MSDYTLGMTAKRLGLSKPTVSKHVKEGKISGEKMSDGSYRISAGELTRFEREYKRPVSGKRQGEGPKDKRDQVGVLTAENADLQRLKDALEAQLSSIEGLHERERLFLERQITDGADRLREVTRDRDQLRRDLDKTNERLDKLQADLSDIARGMIERGQVPWWQRVIGVKS